VAGTSGIKVGIRGSRSVPVKVRAGQISSFRERESGTRVILIGTMHFNPGSIAATDKIVREMARCQNLSSLVIELCPGRYKAMETFQPKGSDLRNLLDNEMQAAVDAAQEEGFQQVILGDSSDAELVRSLTNGVQRTFRDILNPMGGGWKAIGNDFGRLARTLSPDIGVPGSAKLAEEEAVTKNGLDQVNIERKYPDIDDLMEGYIRRMTRPKYGPLSEMDAQLLMGAPVALLRNLVTLMIKLPLQITVLMGSAYATILAAAHSQPTPPPPAVPRRGNTEVISGIAEANNPSSEIRSRMAPHLLPDAANPSNQYALGASGKFPKSTLDLHSLMDSMSSSHFNTPIVLLTFGLLANAFLAVLLARVAAVELLLERDSILANSIREACKNSNGKTVVAVLGLAHCTGVRKRLQA